MRLLTIGIDETTCRFLNASGLITEVQEIDNPEELLEWLRDTGLYTAVILKLSTGLGLYCARVLRKSGVTVPVIGVAQYSAGESWSTQRSIFLENGGDDLLRDPPNPRELVAVIRVIVRRLQGASLDIVECQHGKAQVKINLTTGFVHVNGTEVKLQPKQRTLLLLIASGRGRLLPRSNLIQNMYVDTDVEPTEQILNVYISHIRDRLKSAHPDARAIIETKWSEGFRLTGIVNETPTQTGRVA